MFFPEGRVRVFLCTQPTDMRKSFSGLRAATTQWLQEDPLSGAIFVFINKRGTHVKALYSAIAPALLYLRHPCRRGIALASAYGVNGSNRVRSRVAIRQRLSKSST